SAKLSVIYSEGNNGTKTCRKRSRQTERFFEQKDHFEFCVKLHAKIGIIKMDLNIQKKPAN
ncbi:MAG: hypothetical protein PUB15_08985, partial [Ruminobacter sp.]|nr:hypothetical protein [Ruminobacter sp.]